MPKVVIIEKNANKKEVNVNVENLDIELFSQTCGFRKFNDFENHIIWEVEYEDNIYDIYLFGKSTGRANTENKYDFPPPVDELLFFGNCILVSCFHGTDIVDNLTITQWDNIYESLFGGFEDLGSQDSSEEDELENIPDELKTNEGYLKDDFVVDDSEEIELDGSNDGSNEEDTELLDDDDDDDDDNNELELETEAYIYSDDDN